VTMMMMLIIVDYDYDNLYDKRSKGIDDIKIMLI
jgi:hypothetical protein